MLWVVEAAGLVGRFDWGARSIEVVGIAEECLEQGVI